MFNSLIIYEDILFNVFTLSNRTGLNTLMSEGIWKVCMTLYTECT